jgi:hypothetical protein
MVGGVDDVEEDSGSDMAELFKVENLSYAARGRISTVFLTG